MRRLFFLLFVLTAVASPVAALADTPPCDCFCTSDFGTVGGSNARMPREQCLKACEDLGERMVVCAASPVEYPGNAPRCFTTERCAAQSGVFDSAQPRECPNAQHYCYTNTKANKIKLSVGIGGETSVSDLGEYINLGYKFLLGAAMTLAIVMTMVGGVQYAMAGATGDVEAATGRIKNAVMGLLLLFAAYILLYTINPNLVKLTPPQLPMVKTILSAGADTCENFVQNGYTIQPKSGLCGQVGALKKGPNGASVVEGKTCSFRGCGAGSKEICAGEGDKAQCYACKDVEPLSVTVVKPSSSVCASLKPAVKPSDLTPAGNPSKINYCFYSNDADILPGAAGISFVPGGGTDTSLIIGTCAQVQLDCEAIETCKDYENVHVLAGDFDKPLETLGPPDSLGLGGDETLETICNANPCKSRGMADLQQGCQFSTGTSRLASDCVPKE